MSDYKKVNISICENGFVVTVPETKESFVFATAKKLQKWLEENVTETGQVKDFCNGLDNGTKKPNQNYISKADQLQTKWSTVLTDNASKSIQKEIDQNILDTLTATYGK